MTLTESFVAYQLTGLLWPDSQDHSPCAQQAGRMMSLTESFVAYQLTGLWLDSQDSHVHSKLRHYDIDGEFCG
jgi:hypothetical protein